MEQLITSFMEQYGYFGTFLIIMIENVFPPIPSEVILTFGGFMTTTTSMTVPGVIVASTAGSLAGAILLYGIGYLINIDKLERIIDRWGHILRLKPSDLHKAQEWFTRHGNRTVFFCRMIPLIRSLISIPAGMSKMRFGLFVLYSTAGTLIWNTLLVYAGAALGESWDSVLYYMEVYSSVTYLLIFIAFVAGIYYWYHKKNSREK